MPKKKTKDTYSYKGWLASDKIWKRALAVVGHYILGALIIYIPILVLLLLFGLY